MFILYYSYKTIKINLNQFKAQKGIIEYRLAHMKRQNKRTIQKAPEGDQLVKLKEVKEKLQNFLIIHYLKKRGYTSQYTILYKSYMIITAFIMTIIFNFLFSQTDLKKQNISLLTNEQDASNNFKNLFFFVPLNGKYSIVFFQLMILTTIQIIYEGVLDIYFKYYLKNNVSTSYKQNKKSDNCEQKSQVNAANIEEDEEDSLKNLISSNSNQKQSNILKQTKQLRRISDSLGHSNQKPPMKFIYLVSVLFMESVIWEGILIKKWKKKKIHLVIMCCCLAQFLLWIVINSALKSQQKDALAENHKILFNGYYMFGIK